MSTCLLAILGRPDVRNGCIEVWDSGSWRSGPIQCLRESWKGVTFRYKLTDIHLPDGRRLGIPRPKSFTVTVPLLAQTTGNAVGYEVWWEQGYLRIIPAPTSSMRDYRREQAIYGWWFQPPPPAAGDAHV